MRVCMCSVHVLNIAVIQLELQHLICGSYQDEETCA